MDVIRGSMPPHRRRRLWTPRPSLRLVRGPEPAQAGGDPFLLAMIASLGLFVLWFAMFMGGWTGG